MGIGRIPGSYGIGIQFGCVYFRGFAGPSLDSFGESPHRTPGPFGVGGDLGSVVAGTEKSATDVNQEELERMVRVYGSIKNKSGKKSYTSSKKGKKQYLVAEYAADRDSFFGSEKAYRDDLSAARTELDADGEKLRKFIEPNPATRKKHADWKQAQDVFYAWVRKAYQNQLGAKVDIPKLIKSQMSEKLKTALAKVEVDYGKSFQYGGFNPRPMKRDGYRLGTISEHGIGTAVDVESSKNAHIDTPIWMAIQAYTGKALTHATAQTKWKTAPKELVESFKAINDEFVSRLAKALKDVDDAARKAAEAPGASEAVKAKALVARKYPLAAAVEGNESLKKIGVRFIAEWQKGFFNLPWELVKEFHEEGFVWGATFEHPDLHHFEL